mmetsp:Transcript_5457/g.7735  ORF Transcript_5457/g.7735 Transcript_5457/m.7735 type:complete len:263 (+) Transcript_5457:133-921(+)
MSSHRLVVQSLFSRNVVRQVIQRENAILPLAKSRVMDYSSLVAATTTTTPSSSIATTQSWNVVRFFSDKTASTSESAQEGEAKEQEPTTKEEEAQVEQQEQSNDDKIADLEKQVKDMKDQLLRSLAEQENTRRIAKRDVDSARNFAVTSFAKSLLDTSDNLSRALEAVPEEYRSDKENHAVLATLYEGIQMTDDGLTKAFAKNGLVKFGDVGEVFDPNQHEALFEYPDPNGKPGTIGQVMKKGFSLNDRVIRPAEVGVVKKE